jgi:hypothetical protein
MIWKDEIVEEIHKYREEYAAQFNYDLQAIFLDIKEKEQLHQDRLVSFDKKHDNTDAPSEPAKQPN